MSFRLIPDLNMNDSRLLDNAMRQILDKYKADGGDESRLEPNFADYLLTVMLYLEGRQAVRRFAAEYKYDPSQKRQPVYIEKYADLDSDPFSVRVPEKTAEKKKRSYKKRVTSNQNAGRKVICGGTVYPTLKSCAEKLKVSPSYLRHILNGDQKMPERFSRLGLRYEK